MAKDFRLRGRAVTVRVVCSDSALTVRLADFAQQSPRFDADRMEMEGCVAVEQARGVQHVFDQMGRPPDGRRMRRARSAIASGDSLA